MDADGNSNSKRSRPGRRPTKPLQKLKFKPKVPPPKPKKMTAESDHKGNTFCNFSSQLEQPKPIDEELMKKILKTHEVAEKALPNSKAERPTQNSPLTPPSADVVIPQSGDHKQSQLKALEIPRSFPVTVNSGISYDEESDDDDDDDNDSDNVEFQKAQSSSIECDASTRPAEGLDLLQEQDSKERMFLFQLPKSLPLPRRSSVIDRKGKEVKEGSNLQQLPQGYLGKMLVYKSGKIKMKLGNVMFDVNPGAENTMQQHAIALNTREKHCCLLGEIENRHVIVTPDVDSLLNES